MQGVDKDCQWWAANGKTLLLSHKLGENTCHKTEGMNCSAMQLWKKKNPVCHLVAAHKSPAPRQHTIGWRWTNTRVTDGPTVYPAISAAGPYLQGYV